MKNDEYKSLVGYYGRIAHTDYVFPEYKNDKYVMYAEHCIEDKDGILTLISDDNEHICKIKREHFFVFGKPKFNLGDHIRSKDGKHDGIVYYVCWHYNRQMFFYYLDYGNRKSNNWNFEEDMEIV